MEASAPLSRYASSSADVDLFHNFWWDILGPVLHGRAGYFS